MDKDNTSVHDCLIILLVAIISIIGLIILGFGGYDLNNFMKTVLTICISTFLIIVLFFLSKTIWCPDNKAEYFVLNETNINNRELINSQKRIAVDNDVKRIPAKYFSGNKNLEIIEFFIDKDSSLCIADSAFFSCSKLTTVKIHGGTTVIGENAFSNCKNLETVTFETDLYELKQNTFTSCEKLSKVELPKKLKRIYCDTFKGCKELKKISIAKDIAIIEKNAFVNCNKLKKVSFEDSTSKWVKLKDGSEDNEVMFVSDEKENAKRLLENRNVELKKEE